MCEMQSFSCDECLSSKNKSDRTMMRHQLPSVVNGCSSEEAIANSFKDSFKQNCMPNNAARVDALKQQCADSYRVYLENHTQNCECKSEHVTLNDTIDALLCLKSGKSADEDGISAEHFLLSPASFLIRITNLFNSMLKHGIVPLQFRYGYMVPIIKDTQGSNADIGNYRGITISPIASKFFEHVLKQVFAEHLVTSKNQYGFKKNSSTVHALHSLKGTINYFVNNGSRVFCAFLDASKAFDRVVHTGLIIKLISRGLPLSFIDVIISWYDGLACRVKWGDTFSEWFSVTAGVRQGGVLSPDFYCLYVDDLILKIKHTKKECYFACIFAAALFYADDMALLSPSLKGMTTLLNLCEEYCQEWDICLNSKKSRLMYFGRRTEILSDIYLNNELVKWANEWTYLGVVLKSDLQFCCSITEKIRKFYRCTNAIFRIDGQSTDTVMLRLMESHCIPILTYAIEVIHVSNCDERRQLRVAYNSIFEK